MASRTIHLRVPEGDEEEKKQAKKLSRLDMIPSIQKTTAEMPYGGISDRSRASLSEVAGLFVGILVPAGKSKQFEPYIDKVLNGAMGWDDFLSSVKRDVRSSGLSSENERNSLEVLANVARRGRPSEFDLLSKSYQMFGNPNCQYPDAYREILGIVDRYKAILGKSDWIGILERKDFWDDFIRVLEKYDRKYNQLLSSGLRPEGGAPEWTEAVSGAKRLRFEFTDPSSDTKKLLDISRGYKESKSPIAALDAASPILFGVGAAELANNVIAGLADQIDFTFRDLRERYAHASSGYSVRAIGGTRALDFAPGGLNAEVALFGRTPLGKKTYFDYGVAAFGQKELSFNVSERARMSIDATGGMGYISLNKDVGGLELTLGMEALIFDPSNLRAIVNMGKEKNSQALFCYNVDNVYGGIGASGALLLGASYLGKGYEVGGEIRATPALNVLHSGKNGEAVAITPDNVGTVSKSKFSLAGAYLAYRLSAGLPSLPGGSAFFATLNYGEASRTIEFSALSPSISLSKSTGAPGKGGAQLNLYGHIRAELSRQFASQINYAEAGPRLRAAIGGKRTDIFGGITFDAMRSPTGSPEVGFRFGGTMHF